MKNNWLITAVNLAKNIKTTDALYQTSKKVEKEIGINLSDQPGKVFVEFGLGHGNITQRTLSRIHKTSKLYSFEINKDFCDHVSKHLSDDRLSIINDGAENIASHLKGQVDGIISSIPITMFPIELQNEILEAAYKTLKLATYFSQILYSKKLKLFNALFDEVSITRLVNLPMEYVHHCKKA